MRDAEKQFIDFCKESLGMFDVEVTMQTRPVEDMGISSFESMTLYAALEDEYGIELNMSEVVLVDTLQDLYELVESKREV